MSRWARAARATIVVAVLLVVALTATANAVVLVRTDSQSTDDPHELRPAQVAIVLGSLVRDDGTLGAIVRERVDAGVALHRLGVVDKLLKSGDNGTAQYNEPDAMRDAALRAGVPPEDIFTEDAGFSTWHSMRRARDIFQAVSAIVVTQDFHVPRAVDLGEAAGLNIQGFVAGTTGSGTREVVARIRGLVEATVRPRVTGGPAIPITGDGRTSWSEAPRS